MRSIAFLSAFMLLVSSAFAQFQFFDQMFGAQQEQQPQNTASDSQWFRHNWENAHCDKYLCPGTLSCVHFPHHCPCAFPETEDKIELGDGSMLCASKGGYREGETLRKIELARKGLL